MFEVLEQLMIAIAMDYGVNPVVLTTIHIASTPVMFGALAWVVRNGRAGKSMAVPGFLAVLSYLSSYIYLGVYGHGLPIWIWGVAAFVMTLFGFTTFHNTRKKIAA